MALPQLEPCFLLEGASLNLQPKQRAVARRGTTMPKLTIQTLLLHELEIEVDELPADEEAYANLVDSHADAIWATPGQWNGTTIVDEEGNELYECG